MTREVRACVRAFFRVNKRQKKVLSQLEQDGVIYVTRLSERFGVFNCWGQQKIRRMRPGLESPLFNYTENYKVIWRFDALIHIICIYFSMRNIYVASKFLV